MMRRWSALGPGAALTRVVGLAAQAFVCRAQSAVLVLALLLVAPAGWAQQLQLVQGTLDALRRSAEALDRNDAAGAVALLGGMQASIDTLSQTFTTFRSQAEQASKTREQELLVVMQQITRTFEAEQAAAKTLQELPGKISVLETSQRALEARRGDLMRQSEVLREEVNFRAQCKAHWADGFFWNPRCIALGFQDLFSDRVGHLNSDIERNNRERMQNMGELSRAQADLQAAQASLDQARRDKPRLEAERSALTAKQGGLREAVVNLGDAVVFWSEMRSLSQDRLSAPASALQDRASRLVRRAQQEGQAPAFSSYDIRKLAAFQDSLVEFARTIDDRTNILLLPENGGATATR